MSSTGVVPLTETKDQVILAVNNGNIDKLVGIFALLDKEQAAGLANIGNEYHEPILHIAARKNRADIFDLLVEKGANQRSMYGPDDLHHVAAQAGAIEITLRLIKNGIKPKMNLRNKWASDMATDRKHNEQARILREAEGRDQLKGTQDHDSRRGLMRRETRTDKKLFYRSKH